MITVTRVAVAAVILGLLGLYFENSVSKPQTECIPLDVYDLPNEAIVAYELSTPISI